MKKAALVLSSGGARGMAHIGVIEELINEGKLAFKQAYEKRKC